MSMARASLVRRTEKKIRARILEDAPKWFKPVRRAPPLAFRNSSKLLQEIVLPEDPYVAELYKRIPEFKYQSFEPGDIHPALGRQLAHRWMELIELGFSKERALSIVEAEFVNTKRAQDRAYDYERVRAYKERGEKLPPRKMINRIQLLERKTLLEGLLKLKERNAREASKEALAAAEEHGGDIDDSDDDDDDDDDE